MTHPTPPDLLTLHAVRTLGYASTARVAGRTGLPVATAEEHLLDAQAFGQVSWTGYHGDGGWSLTEAGKAHEEKLLAAELDATGARALVEAVHHDFLPLNETVSATCTAWQLAELEMTDDPPTLTEILAALSGPARRLEGLEQRLTSVLPRFAGYHERFAGALERAEHDLHWVTGTDRDSCHRVWFELHEDLAATLGLGH
ncbi:hypothetical protein [Kineosporia succinea]|uniref:Transcriptional regulator n=1 Tax=Kineosporia succinea TaxID=84632 RepID=A0ABT9NWZ7_9ACTN|nr:hypothetical protein [Kineosporia succinea]MDP9824949.1 hypothetical protein [Kineosporia succinea]